MIDYLAVCAHPQLKSFTFFDGVTIKMCPYCKEFDKHRHDILNHYTAPRIRPHQRTYETLLTQAGLAMDAGSLNKNTTLLYLGLLNDLATLHVLEYRALCGDIKRGLFWRDRAKDFMKPDAVDDIAHDKRVESFPHTRSMPRLRLYFCTKCREQVIDAAGKEVRNTVGLYENENHECRLRTYDLLGNLMKSEVLK